MYEIVDRQTGRVVGKAKTLRGARRSVDRRDNAYGGYRFFHRAARDSSWRTMGTQEIIDAVQALAPLNVEVCGVIRDGEIIWSSKT